LHEEKQDPQTNQPLSQNGLSLWKLKFF